MRSACTPPGRAGQQELQRFRQQDQKHQTKDQRQHAADVEDHAPAEIGDDQRVRETADHPAEGKAGPHQRHAGGPHARRGIFRRQRDETWRRAAEADAGEEAIEHQRRDRSGGRRQQREHADQQRRQNEQALAPDLVGDGAEADGTERRAEQRGREDRPELRQRQLQGLRDEGRRDADRLRVHAVEQIDERAEDDHRHLQAAKPGVVDECRYVDARRHDVSPHTALTTSRLGAHLSVPGAELQSKPDRRKAALVVRAVQA